MEKEKNYNLAPIIKLAKKQQSEVEITADYKDLGVRVRIIVTPE